MTDQDPIHAMAKLCDVDGMPSTASVFGIVGGLTEAGYLQREDGRIAPGNRFFARQLLGPVRAGVSQPASQEPEEALALDDYLIDEPDRATLHCVRGDSMSGALSVEGDLVVVEHKTPGRPGDIVLAVVDGEFTVKDPHMGGDERYFLEASGPPSNSTDAPPGSAWCRRRRRETRTEVTGLAPS